MTFDSLTYTGSSSSHGPAEAPAEHWRASLSGGVRGPSTVTSDLVLAHAGMGVLYALDRSDGSVRWTANVGGQSFGAPRVHDGTVYLASSGRLVHAIELATGNVRWTADAGHWVYRDLTLAGDKLLVSSSDGKLRALDPASGERRWSASIGGKEGNPASVAGSEAYAAGGRKVHALSLEKGRKARSVTLAGISCVRTAPMVAGDLLIVGTLDKGLTGSVIALDRQTLAERWRVAMKGQVTGALALSDGTVIAASEKGTCGIELASGTTRWELWNCSSAVCHSMVTAGGIAYVGDHWAGVRAVDVATGVLRWTFSLANGGCSPTVADGTLYVGTQSGLVALTDTGSAAAGSSS